MHHRVAHLGALAAAQRLLQPFVLGQRFGFDDVTRDRLQPRRLGRGPAPLGARAQPAAGAVEGGHADAGRVHQRADLQLRQVTLLLRAAVFDHGHEAMLALIGGEAAHARTQALAPPVGQGQRDMDLQRRGTGLQRRPRRTAFPGQQGLQFRRGVGQHHRHLAHQRLEGRVRAHDQSDLVEHQHAGRAQVEPLRQLVQRTVGLGACHMLGGGILQYTQQQRLAALGRHLVGRNTAPAFTPRGVDQALLAQQRHRLGRQACRQLAARVDVRGLVFQRLQQHRVGADQRRARATGEVHIGVVYRHQAEAGILQRGRKGRGPEHAQHFQRRARPHRRQRRRKRRARRLHLHAQRQVTPDAPATQLRRARIAQRHAGRLWRLRGVLQPHAQPGRAGLAQHRIQLRRRQAGLGAEQAHRRAIAETQAADVVEQQQRLVHAVEQRGQRRARRQQRGRRFDGLRVHRHGARERDWATPAIIAQATSSSWRTATSARSRARLTSATESISTSAASRMSNSDSRSTARTTS